MSYRRSVQVALVVAFAAAVGAWGWALARDKFSHERHAALFSSCDGCHAVEPTGITYPDPALCSGCHNGELAREVDWPGPAPRADNLTFSHADVLQAMEEAGEDASCDVCHIEPGGGPMDVRLKPPSHTPYWVQDHRSLAAGDGAACQTCHFREQYCVGCHLGSENVDVPGRDVSRYHPANFMQQHQAAAWGRENECSSCHNPQVFCRSCHSALGLGTDGFRTNTGYHNENTSFLFGHGQAARQGLESCATCHAQRDCLVCHSATAGRRVNPHGPDFDPKHLADKNPTMCLFCHTREIIDR